MAKLGIRTVLLFMAAMLLGVGFYQRLWVVQMDLNTERQHRSQYQKLYNDALDEVADWRKKYDTELTECDRRLQKLHDENFELKKALSEKVSKESAEQDRYVMLHIAVARGMYGRDDWEVVRFLEKLKDHEKLGVPRHAGTDSKCGFDLGRMKRLLRSIGNPLCGIPAVHVAGTKGKGSTVGFLSNILRAAGFSVGTYTSPHIRSLGERIAIDNRPTSMRSLDNLYENVRFRLEAAITAEKGKLTHFEVLTGLAFLYFKQSEVDVAVIETGLGGSRDATNVIKPEGLAAAVITTVGEEHMEALGGSLESIASAKAGIIKQTRPVVISRQSSVVDIIFQETALPKQAPIVRAFGKFVHAAMKDICRTDEECFQICDLLVKSGFLLHKGRRLDKDFEIPNCKLRMLGNHQLENAMTAVCTALCLREDGWKIPDTAFRIGLERTSLLGRFQLLPREQASSLGLRGTTVVLDGAHTCGSAAALASTLRSVFPTEKVILIVAMASDKDHNGFASALLDVRPVAVFLTEVNVAGSHLRSASKDSLLSVWQQAGAAAKDRGDYGDDVLIVGSSLSVRSAAEHAAEILQQDEGSVVCITGSLHAVSDALRIVDP